MNSAALVDRLNFAYQLTNGRFAGQVFDAPKLLAMGLLTPTGAGSFAGLSGGAKTVSATSAAGAPKLMGVAAVAPAQAADVHTAPGAEVALRVLESTMIGSSVSGQTNQLIEKQLAQQPAGQGPTDTLNLLTALVMGSPEFQMR